MTEPLPPLPNPAGFDPPPGGRLDNETTTTIEAVEILLVDNGEGEHSLPDSHSYRTEWRVGMASDEATAFDVLAAVGRPPSGESLRRYTWNSETRKYAAGEVIDEQAVVASRNAVRDPANPSWWLVRIGYEGRNNPVAEPPQVNYDQYPFTEYDVRDYWGNLYGNSARDPIEGGMPVNRSRNTLTIIRNIRYEDWDPNKAARFRHTLNLKPFRHSNLVDSALGAVAGSAASSLVSQPGTAYLAALSATRQVRSLGTTARPTAPNGAKVPSLTSYYWQLMARIEFDDTTFARKDGTRERRRWRHVVLDAGWSKIKDGSRTPILPMGTKPTQPQLLDGNGRPLPAPSGNPPALLTVPTWNITVVPGDAITFETLQDTPLVVASPGLLSLAPGAEQVTIIPGAGSGGEGQSKGIAELIDPLPGGSSKTGAWKYTPSGGQTGWDYFAYYADAADAGSPRAKGYVAILISPRPVYLAFDRYEAKNWDDISAWIGDW